MPYATQQDLVDRFGAEELIQLTDRTNAPPAAIDAVVAGKALADADETIDGYIAAKVALPLASVPDLVKRWACDIARYFLYAAAPTETVRRNYEDALRQLRDVANGKIVLQVDGAAAPTSGAEVRIDAPPRVMSRDTLKGF